MNVAEAQNATTTAEGAATETAAGLDEFTTKTTEAHAQINAAIDDLTQFLTGVSASLEHAQTATLDAHTQVADLRSDADAKGYNSRFPLATAAEHTEHAQASTASATDQVTTCAAALDRVRGAATEALAALAQTATEPAASIASAAAALAEARAYLQAAGDE